MVKATVKVHVFKQGRYLATRMVFVTFRGDRDEFEDYCQQIAYAVEEEYEADSHRLEILGVRE